MAIDPRISLAVQPVDVLGRFSAVTDLLRGQEQLKQDRAMNPMRQKLFEIGLQESEAQLPVNLQRAALLSSPEQHIIDFQELGDNIRLKGAERLKPFLDSNDIVGANNELDLAINTLQSKGVDQSLIQPLVNAKATLNAENGLQTLKSQTDYFLQQAGLGQTQQKSVSQREFDDLVSIVEADPKLETAQGKAAAVKLRIAPPAGISAEERIATDPELADKIAENKELQAEKTETGKLKARFKLEPEIAKAIDKVKAEVKALADDEKIAKSNAKALEIYEVGIRNLASALGKTTTGPIASLFTGLTDSARTADGAKAIMVPVLKQMFRSAGEGTFTDKDQEVLENMIPTRQDNPATAKAKLEMIDAIVQTKLGGTSISTTENEFAGFKVIK